jgi:hypothetical protein
MAIEIVGHLAATSEWPMDDLYSLWATFSFMCYICDDPTVGHRVAMDRCRHRARSWNDLDNYYTLFASLTQLDNPEACFLIGIPMVFMDNHTLGHASTISPAQLMAGTMWQPIYHHIAL